MPPTEGIGFYVWNLAQFLVGQGHSVQIVTRGERGKGAYEVVDGVPIWRPRFYPIYPFHVHLHGLFVQRLVRRLEEEVDLFHLHTPLPPPVHSRRPVLLTVHSTMFADVRAHRIESVLDILNWLQVPVSVLLEARLLRTTDRITAVSETAAQDMQPYRPQAAESVEVMGNGVDIRFFSPDAGEAVEPGTLLFVGRLAPGKGLPDLVQAMATAVQCCPEARLWVAGSGPRHSQLTSLIAQHGLERQVSVLGYVGSRERLRELYRKAWALVMPSHHETGPTVMLEAMACGTPAISTPVGLAPHAIADGTNGLLVPAHAPDELARAICRLLGDAELRARLGAAARHTVEERFSWQAVGRGYLKCYGQLLNESKR